MEQEIANNGRQGTKEDDYEWYPNHEPEVIEYLQAQLPQMRKMAEIMRACDYLYSGDHGSDTFMKKVKEIEEKYAE